jgi:hypothetical protein
MTEVLCTSHHGMRALSSKIYHIYLHDIMYLSLRIKKDLHDHKDVLSIQVVLDAL